MNITKGTLRRRFHRLRKHAELEVKEAVQGSITKDIIEARKFLEYTFKPWVRKHGKNLIEHYQNRVDDAELVFTDNAAKLLEA